MLICRIRIQMTREMWATKKTITRYGQGIYLYGFTLSASFWAPLENHTETYMTYGRSFNRLLGIPHIHAPFFLKKAASRPIQFKWYAFGHDLQHIPQPTFHIHSCCCCSCNQKKDWLICIDQCICICQFSHPLRPKPADYKEEEQNRPITIKEDVHKMELMDAATWWWSNNKQWQL